MVAIIFSYMAQYSILFPKSSSIYCLYLTAALFPSRFQRLPVPLSLSPIDIIRETKMKDFIQLFNSIVI